jgi:aminopeptidase N
VTAPDHYRVVANGLLQEEKDLDDGLRFTHWLEAVPVATKVMVVGAARFVVRDVGRIRDIPISAWVFEGNPESVFRDFARVPDMVKFFEETIGPYPYAKLALVQSRTRWGGMENPGVVFLSEKVVSRLAACQDYLVHEIAHHWFGDSVTEADWTHIWLSEGFATYLTHLYTEARSGSRALAAAMKKDRAHVFRYERKRPRERIVDPAIFDPRKRLTPVTYQKASWVLHMLRRRIGDEAFRRTLRTFHERFRHANAATGDFVSVAEEVRARDLARFFRQWLHRPGHPRLVGRWKYDGASKVLKIEIEQVRLDGEPYELLMDVAVHGPGGEEPEIKQIWMREEKLALNFSCPQPPTRVAFDPDVWLLAEMDWRKK